jgi:hypothetical protein
MGVQATACVLRVKAPVSQLPSFATIDRRPARLSAASGNAALAKCSGMDGHRSRLMQLKAKLADHGELIINCLAVLALLAVGIVWGPV